jgi:hypothetical protein
MKPNPPSRWYCAACGQRVDRVRVTRRCLDCEVKDLLAGEWERELQGLACVWAAEADSEPVTRRRDQGSRFSLDPDG